MLEFDATRIAQGSFTLDADFSVETGSRVAIVGPSGAGKSTLINALAGFLPLAQGQIRYNEMRLDPLPPAKRPLSILFQDHNLLPHMSVFDNVALGVNPNLRLTDTQRRAVHNALERTGLAGLEARKPAELSGGQISRAGLARVLLRARPMILLDEPFAALGPALKSAMLDLVAEIASSEKATVLMITHDPQDALRLCPETILVADGRAHKPLQTNALFDNPPPALAEYLGQMPQVRR